MPMTKEQRAEYQKKYRAENREKANEYSRRYRALSPIPHKEQVKRWRKENPELAVKMRDLDNNFYPKMRAIPKLLEKVERYLNEVESSPLWLCK